MMDQSAQSGSLLIIQDGNKTRTVHTKGTVQSQKAVSAYFTSKQILPFDFAEHNRVVQRHKAVTAH